MRNKKPAPAKIIAKDRDALLEKLHVLLREEKMLLTSLESEMNIVEMEGQHLNVRQYHLELAECRKYISILEDRISAIEKEKKS